MGLIRDKYILSSVSEFFEVFNIEDKETVFVSVDKLDCLHKIEELYYDEQVIR